MTTKQKMISQKFRQWQINITSGSYIHEKILYEFQPARMDEPTFSSRKWKCFQNIKLSIKMEFYLI